MHFDNTYCHRCGERLGEREVAGRLRPSCESCGETVFLDPKVAVAVVATDDGKILMVKRAIDPMMGRWSLPAGYVDRGEVVEEAAAFAKSGRRPASRYDLARWWACTPVRALRSY